MGRITFPILLIFLSLTSFVSRREVVLTIASQAARILPENWFLVHTDTSLTVYFCETARDMPFSSKKTFVSNSDEYGDQFWGAPFPDSVYVLEFDRRNTWSKGVKIEGKKQSKKCNAILRINIFIGEYNSAKSNIYYYLYPIDITCSVSIINTIAFTEKRKPKDKYYRENGLTLQAEYR